MPTLEEQALAQITAGLQSGTLNPEQAFAVYYGAAPLIGIDSPPPPGPTPDLDLQAFNGVISGFDDEEANLARSLLALAPPTTTVATPTPKTPTTVSANGTVQDSSGAPVLNQPFGADFFEPTLNATVDLVAIEQQKVQFEAQLAESTRQFNEQLAIERQQFGDQLALQRDQFGLDEQSLAEQIRQFDAQQGEAIRQYNQNLEFQRAQFDFNVQTQQQQFGEQQRQFDVSSGLDMAQVIARLRANPASAAELAILQGAIVPGAGGVNARATDLAGGGAAPGVANSVFTTGNQSLSLPGTFSGAQLQNLQSNPDLASNLDSFAKAARDPNLFQRSVDALIPAGFGGVGSPA